MPDLKKPQLFGGIEGGGTKFVCAVGSSPEDIRAEVRFATTEPAETIQKTVDFFRSQIELLGPLAGLGLACFGPVDLRTDSPTFGYHHLNPQTGLGECGYPGWHLARPGSPDRI